MGVHRLCERWGYVPEEAVAAPSWVLWLTDYLDAILPEPVEEPYG